MLQTVCLIVDKNALPCYARLDDNNSARFKAYKITFNHTQLDKHL